MNALRLLPLLALFSCTATGDPPYDTSVLFQAPDKLGGCAVGNLDPSAEGNEIAAVCRNGDFYVLRRGERGGPFGATLVFQTPGAMIQCAVGDAHPEHAGPELYAVGMMRGPEEDAGPGAAFVVFEEDGGWRSEILMESEALLHGVCVFDGAAFVTGYDRKLTRLTREDGGWRPEVVAELPGAGKSAIAFGGGVAVACTDGSVVLVREEEGQWTSAVVDFRASGRARLGATEGLLAVCDDDGTLSLLDADDGFRRDEIFHAPSKLRGAAVGDFDPTQAGIEAATAGYTNELTVLTFEGGEWDAETVFTDDGRFHHLATGDVDGDGLDELVGCGYAARVVLVDPSPSG